MVLSALVWSCGAADVQLFEARRILMDTVVAITIYAEEEPPGWRRHVDAAFRAIEDVESLTSSYNDSSQISRVNQKAGNAFVPVNPLVLTILRQAQEVSRMSGGAFDITTLPLVRLWNFKAEHPRVPDSSAVSAKCALVDYNKVEIVGNEVRLAEEGMGFDLGAIAKGHAVDRAAEVLSRFGYSDFLVEAGGDLLAQASDLTRGRRKIWIRHPRQGDAFFANIAMDAGAVATSGDYERYFERQGRRYHHILDPATGYPGRPTVSVTIFGPTTSLADALATAAFVLGPKRGLDFIEKQPGIEGLIIFEKDSQLQWKASSGIANDLNIIAQ